MQQKLEEIIHNISAVLISVCVKSLSRRKRQDSDLMNSMFRA
jgi:hypothetical protein